MKASVRHALAGALLVLTAAALAGCGSGVRFVPMQESAQYTPKDRNAPIEIHEGSVLTPHVVIGKLSACKTMDAAFNDSSTYDQLLASLKDYARKVGADALIEVKPSADEGGGLKSQVRMDAVAVRYLTLESSVGSKSDSK